MQLHFISFVGQSVRDVLGVQISCSLIEVSRLTISHKWQILNAALNVTGFESLSKKELLGVFHFDHL